jgi:hypothetical protein
MPLRVAKINGNSSVNKRCGDYSKSPADETGSFVYLVSTEYIGHMLETECEGRPCIPLMLF